MSDEETYFIEIENHNLVRKNLLESLRDTVTSLQDLERLKEVRVALVEKETEFKKILSEIKSLNANLKSKLPKVKTPSVSERRTVKRKGSGKKKTSSKKKGASELHRLEDELEMIESKLNSLSKR